MIDIVEGKKVFIVAGSHRGMFAQVITAPIKDKLYVQLIGYSNDPIRVKHKHLVDISQSWKWNK